MPEFRVRAQRDYIEHESTILTVEADTIEAALTKAKKMEVDGDMDEIWSGDDGGADPDSYRWTVTGPNGETLEGTGTADLDE